MSREMQQTINTTAVSSSWRSWNECTSFRLAGLISYCPSCNETCALSILGRKILQEIRCRRHPLGCTFCTRLLSDMHLSRCFWNSSLLRVMQLRSLLLSLRKSMLGNTVPVHVAEIEIPVLILRNQDWEFYVRKLNKSFRRNKGNAVEKNLKDFFLRTS